MVQRLPLQKTQGGPGLFRCLLRWLEDVPQNLRLLLGNSRREWTKLERPNVDEGMLMNTPLHSAQDVSREILILLCLVLKNFLPAVFEMIVSVAMPNLCEIFVKFAEQDIRKVV
ncbi:hypothetical protein N7475_003563 [Penicillium sp. IBT 31633x]|nr:hypothetical protein N7475_003563 [Penicillium sp. IBT 31633x]